MVIATIDKKTGEKKRSRFVKQDEKCIMRLESTEPFCLEPFKELPQLGRLVNVPFTSYLIVSFPTFAPTVKLYYIINPRLLDLVYKIVVRCFSDNCAL